MDWRDGLLMLIGSQTIQLQQAFMRLQEIEAGLNEMKKAHGHQHEEEGLGFPGTPSFEDGPEQDVA